MSSFGAIAAVAALGFSAGSCGTTASTHEAAFWFADVSFELSARDTARLQGPIADGEKERIQSIARSELETAYAGLRIAFSDRRQAFYCVSVVQDLPEVSRLARGAAGESRAFGPLGGQGSVSFGILAKNAIYYAPPDANRTAIIDGIGRGIGRAAVHEFAHQLLRDPLMDTGRDRESYEYGSADRAAQYYGTLHWNGAWGALVKKLGR